MAKVSISNKEECIGCGSCASVCPSVFELGKDGKVKVKKANVSGKDEQCAKDAADSCPVNVIKVK